MNAPTFTSLMEFEKTQLKYFIFVTQILILIVSIYNLINTPSEKYWILALVLSSLIIILIFSAMGNNKLIPNTSSTIKSKSVNKFQTQEDISNEKIPDVLEDGWDLPL